MKPLEKISLTKEKETLLITLYARARESRLPDSLLNDRFAAEVVRQLDYDFSKLKVRRDAAIGVAMRAHTLDLWTRDFISRHPNATVLHLACGLDSRVFRIDPPPSVRWFDVDYPEVIALRHRLYPERAGYTMIGSSVTDTQWLEEVPNDSPAMIVAEGLTMYLQEEDIHKLLRAVTAYLPGGEIAFDVLSHLGVRLVQRSRMVRATGAVFHWGIDDPHELEQRIPKLELITDKIGYTPAQIARFSWRSRLVIRIMRAIPALRKLGRILRFRF